MNKSTVAAMLVLASLPLAASHADLPGNHPAYLHALSDLRAARWMLDHRPGDPAVSAHEDVAIREIDAALREIKLAAIDDGKDLRDHEPVDARMDYRGRLQKASELLHKTHNDVDREEDDPMARGLKHRALEHIDIALHETDGAIWDMEHRR